MADNRSAVEHGDIQSLCIALNKVIQRVEKLERQIEKWKKELGEGRTERP